MGKILDDRIVDDVDIIQINYKPNVEQHTLDSTSGEIVITYVCLVRVAYWLLDANGARLRRLVSTHKPYSSSSELTSAQFANVIESITTTIKSCILNDIDGCTVP